jgi:iron complex outermembrane receptor protein
MLNAFLSPGLRSGAEVSLSVLNVGRSKLALACALACSLGAAGPAWAQAPAAPGPESAPQRALEQNPPQAGGKREVSAELARVVVTANPLGNREVAAPVSVLQGTDLFLNRGSTLGETLAGLPGVSATQFGPNASRPVIRGLDGDRVKMLSNGATSFDASALSFDHAVPIDPLLIDRVEVVRGPAALIHGGNAVGGVVNAIDSRIPLERSEGASGVAEVRLGGANRERAMGARLDGGAGALAYHVDAFSRRTDDLRVPSFRPVSDGETRPLSTRVQNSASRTRGGSVGAAYFVDGARVGLSADTYDSRYGVAAEPDVEVQMKRDHIGGVYEWSSSSEAAWLKAFKANLNHTRYRHDEVHMDHEEHGHGMHAMGGDDHDDDHGHQGEGTTFRSTATEARVQIEHRERAGWRGVWGLDGEGQGFSARGEEAFVPSTHTRRMGVFALEETRWSGGTLSVGARLERVRVESKGDEPGAHEARFGSATSRSFSPKSLSMANVLPLSKGWSWSTSLSHTERAPASFELFANGVHVATHAYEVGDPSLRTEQGRNVDTALQWRQGEASVRLGVFQSNFSRFISMEATGREVEVDQHGEHVDLPEYRFQTVRARLRGVEIEGQWPLGSTGLKLSGKLDFTQADNLSRGQPLPRVAPLRAHLGLDFHHGAWEGHVDVEHAARQGRVPSYDSPTAAYTLLNVAINRSFSAGPLEGLWFVKLGNLTHALAYNASSIQTVRGLSPLAGRSIKAGVRLAI